MIVDIEDQIEEVDIKGYRFECPECGKVIESDSRKKTKGHAKQHVVFAHD